MNLEKSLLFPECCEIVSVIVKTLITMFPVHTLICHEKQRFLPALNVLHIPKASVQIFHYILLLVRTHDSHPNHYSLNLKRQTK